MTLSIKVYVFKYFKYFIFNILKYFYIKDFARSNGFGLWIPMEELIFSAWAVFAPLV